MCSRLNQLRFLLTAMTFSCSSFAGPWFTGPLLAPAGHTIPVGHAVLEPYFFVTTSNSVYNNNWDMVSITHHESYLINPVLSYGLTKKIDVQFNAGYLVNQFLGHTFQDATDTSMTLGYQVLEQKNSRWIPDLRASIQQVIPTGRFSSLNPVNNGTDSSGLGSNQTGFALNFQHLTPFNDTNYLRMRLSIAYYYAGWVNIKGVTSFGGAPNTNGTINPGDQISADIAAELTLTQHWVAVLEGYFSNREGTTFKGTQGTIESGALAPLGYMQMDQITFAPAIEYNFNQNIGLIGGFWFSAAGRNSSVFRTAALALNIFW